MPSFLKFMRELAIDLVIVALLVLFIRGFIFAPFRVHGPSMCDTFNNYDGECLNGAGEFIMTLRFTPLQRGDVAVFKNPNEGVKERLIKRVVGLPGDTLKIENGAVYLMDESGEFEVLEEPYLNETNQNNTQLYNSNSETYEVPEGYYFIMGDNRVRSSDSRRCFQALGCYGIISPFISEDLLEGEVKLVLFPLDQFRVIKAVEY